MRYLCIFLFGYISFGQQLEKVDFIAANATLIPNSSTKSISGSVSYDFKVVEKIDSIQIDAKNMIFSSLLLNGKKVPFSVTKNHLKLYEGYSIGRNKLVLQYEATPKQALYFIGQGDDLQIWTQGQGKYTSHWFPCFDDVNEKVIFNISIKYDSSYSCIANGVLKKVSSDFGISNHQFEMKKPMSSYLLMIAIGKFEVSKSKTTSRIPMELYINKSDFLKLEPTYRYTKQVFDFLEEETGFHYPWKVYKQVPIKDFLYAGMENTSATLFSQDFVVDDIGFNDQNYVNVNAHELAHQWFGNLVTAKSGKHHWLQEGFATYFALKAEKEIFGEDYFYHKLYESAILIEKNSKNDTIPLLNEKASSLTFYQKGALALFFLENEIGSKKFKKAIKKYLKKYKFKSVETNDFLNIIERTAKFDRQNFEKTWLETSKFEKSIVNNIVQKSSFLQQLENIKNLHNTSLESKKEIFKSLMNKDVYHPIKVEILAQLENESFIDKKEIVIAALQTNNIEVRQAAVFYQKNIPIEVRTQFETLLDDLSYTTQQEAFSSLWNSFPDFRTKYLHKAEKWIGSNNINLRIMYLMYSQQDPNIEIDIKNEQLQELVTYSDPKFESSIRQNALNALFLLGSKNELAIRNLVQATTHFKWQFAKFAKERLKILSKNTDVNILLDKLQSEFSDAEKAQISKLK